MRRLLLVLLPLAQVAAAQVPTPAAVPHTILMRGTAERELDPEKLDLLLTYRFTDDVKTGERAQTQEANLRQVLSQAGLSAGKLVLEELSANGYGGLSKVNNNSVAIIKVYRLTLDNPQLVSTLLPQLAQTGADNLRVVNLQSTKLAAAKTELAAQAVADARHKAAVVAQAASAQLGSPLSLVEVPANAQVVAEARGGAYKQAAGGYYESYQAQQASAEPPPSLRKIGVLVRYDVLFEIKP